MSINTKRLTERLELQLLTVINNASGETENIYTTFKTVFASQTRRAGNVKFDGHSPNYFDNVSFYLRYQQDLPKKGLGILYEGEFYKVMNVTVVPRNQATVLDCVKGY